jgi:transcriptional regulator with XRE-family HTH domain
VKGDLKTIFGEILKELRLKKDLTQQQLADYAGMDRAYISELERGLLMPSVETVFKVAKVLKVKPQHIIELMDDQTKS